MSTDPRAKTHGPFRVDQLTPGDDYELSHGHAIYCPPSGSRHGGRNTIGAALLGSDPAVSSVGVDVGYALRPDTLRAPDVAVGNVPDAPGFVQGVPPLAVEYADTGTDERDLAVKVGQFLEAGARFVWVVRLVGAPRVEVHAAGEPMRVELPGALLTAPGILQNAVAVEALFDRDAAREATLRNLLQRRGYPSVDAIREEGREEGHEEGLRAALRAVLRGRRLTLSTADDARIDACHDRAQLERWLERAPIVLAAAAVFERETP